MVVGELVEGVGIHLGEVLPVQGVELGRIPTGRLDEAGGRDRAGRRLQRAAPSRLPNTGRGIALHPGRASLTRRTSPAWTIRSPPAPPRPRPRGRPRPRRRPAPRIRRASSSSVPAAPWSPGARPTSRGRSSPCAGRPSSTSRRSANPVSSASRSIGRPPDASRRLVMAAGEVRREVALPPVGVDPDPDDHPRVVRPETLALAQHAGELAQLHGDASRVAAACALSSPISSAFGPPTSITRSFGHLSRIAPTGSPAVSSAASAIASATVPQPPGPVRRQPGGPEAELRQECRVGRRRPRPAVAAAARRLLVGDREADLGHAVRQPAADDVVRSTRRWRTARRGRTRRARRRSRSRPQPATAPAASMVSGCSSSKAAWRARTASSTAVLGDDRGD